MLFLLNWSLTGMTMYITMLVQIGEALGEGIVILPLTILTHFANDPWYVRGVPAFR